MIGGLDNVGLAARDVGRLADFFEAQLGLAVERHDAAATVAVGTSYLYIFATSSEREGATRDPSLTDNPRGLDHVSFTVQDVDAAFTTLAARGVRFAAPPETDAEWGLRMAAFTDPEDNVYFLVQNIENGTAS